MQILILDDQLDKAKGLAEDIAYLSDGQMHANVARTEAEATNHISQRHREGLPAYSALLIDQRLSGGEQGIEVMQRLLKESPESEALLFTANGDAQIGLRALQAGALHYFDRITYLKDELILRLKEIHILRGFDETVLRANKATTLDETTQMIVESGRLLGFERTRLWRCQIDTFKGWAESGNVGLEDFPNVKMSVEESWYVPRLLKHPHDVCVFEPKPIDDPQSSFLVRHFGHLGYTAPLGEWATLRLRWDDATRAVLMLDNATHEGHGIDLNRQRLLFRFARSAAAALARAVAIDEQMHSQAIAKHVVELIASKKIDDALKEIADQLCKADPAIANTNLTIVFKNEAAHTADYRCVCGKCKFEQPYRHNLDRKFIVPYLLKNQSDKPLLHSSAEDIRLFHETHDLQLEDKLIHSFVFVPLCVGGKTTGALVLNNDLDIDIHYSTEQVNRLERLALEIAAGIEAGRLREVAEWDSNRRDTLINIRKALDVDIQALDEDSQTSIGRREIWHLILTALTAGQGIGFNRACLFLMDKSGMMVSETGIGYCTAKEAHDAWKDWDPVQPIKDFRSLPFILEEYCRARTGSQGRTPLEAFAKLKHQFADCLILNDAVNDITWLSVEEARLGLPAPFTKFVGANPCALIPIRAGEHILGVVYVDNHAEENDITRESLEEARALLSYAAQAFQSQRERAEKMGLIELSNNSFERGLLTNNLQGICNQALALTNADLIVIYPMQPGKITEEVLPYGQYGLASGSQSDKTISELPKHHPLGLTQCVLMNKLLIAPDVSLYDQSEFYGQPLSEHVFIQDEKLKGLISVSLHDKIQGDSFGVLHLGYRRPIVDVQHEVKQANFLKRIARRAVRADWRRNNEMTLRGAEASAHHKITTLSLDAKAMVADIAKLAAVEMRTLLGKDRVNQESSVTLLRWKSATETERAIQYRMDYRIKATTFVPEEIDRLTDPNFKINKDHFGMGVDLK